MRFAVGVWYSFSRCSFFISSSKIVVVGTQYCAERIHFGVLDLGCSSHLVCEFRLSAGMGIKLSNFLAFELRTEEHAQCSEVLWDGPQPPVPLPRLHLHDAVI